MHFGGERIKAMNQAKFYLQNVLDSLEFCDDKYSAVDLADALVLLTEWREFRSPDFKQIANRLKNPIIFDGRNIWRHFDFSCFHYRSPP